MTGAPVIVNLTGGRLAVLVDGRRVWVGSQDEWSTARRVCALRRPGAETLVNGRCVGHLELDETHGTVLVMDWHDPAGCEHKAVR